MCGHLPFVYLYCLWSGHVFSLVNVCLFVFSETSMMVFMRIYFDLLVVIVSLFVLSDDNHESYWSHVISKVWLFVLTGTIVCLFVLSSDSHVHSYSHCLKLLSACLFFPMISTCFLEVIVLVIVCLFVLDITYAVRLYDYNYAPCRWWDYSWENDWWRFLEITTWNMEQI